MRSNPSNTDDIIDSRDIIARIDELESGRQDLVDAVDSAKETLEDSEDDTSALKNDEDIILGLRGEVGTAELALSDWDDDNGDELAALRALAEEGASESSDWSYGETLIFSDYFSEYAQQFVEDIDGFPKGIPAYVVVDWEATAENLKADYSTVDFDGQEYLIRCN